MEFTIRIATKKDKYKIYSLVEQFATYERKKHEDIHLTLEKIESHGFGKNKYFHILLAEYKKEPAGYALYFFSYSAAEGAPVLAVENLFVTEAYQSHGLGTALLSYLARLALEEHCCRMDGHAFTWNKQSIEFYEFLGAHTRTDQVHFRLSGDSLEQLANHCLE